MKFLVWDSSTRCGAFAVMEAERRPGYESAEMKILSESMVDVRAHHSEKLLSAIDFVLKSSGCRLEDMGFLGVGVGPGSFTGLRISLSVARSWGQLLHIPLVPLSSLAAMARSAARWLAMEPSTIVVVGQDACKGQVYGLWGHARSILECTVPPGLVNGPRQSRTWKTSVQEGIFTPGDFSQQVKKKIGSKSRWFFCGDAASVYPQLCEKWPQNRKLESDHFQSLAPLLGRELGAMAWQAYQLGAATEPLSVTPRYLRLPDAVMKRQQTSSHEKI